MREETEKRVTLRGNEITVTETENRKYSRRMREFTGGMVEGRNAVIEAFRSGKTVDKLFVPASSQDGPIRTIIREAKNTIPSSIM